MMLSTAYILLYTAVNVHALGRTVLHGDVFIELIGAIFTEPPTESSCSNIETESVQNIQAIKWTLSELNRVNYIPNVDIGLRVSPTCREVGENKRLALQLATELHEPNGTRIVGVIGSDYSSETEDISRLLSALSDEDRLIQLSFSSTSASLRNRDIYKNFFRTIPPDDIQVGVMIEFMETLNWTYMAIVYDDNSYGRGGKDELLARMKFNGLDICFPVTVAVESPYNLDKLEHDIEDKIIDANVPISGVLVFGSSMLADHVLSVTEKVIAEKNSSTRPVFLFSEAAGYIQGHSANISKGAFILSPPRRIISLFQTYWKDIFTDFSKLYKELESNIWIRDLYVSKFNCLLADSFQDNTCTNISESDFIANIPASVYNQYAIQAAMVMAKLVKKVYTDTCPGMTKVCPDFLNTKITPRSKFIDELHKLSEIDFDDFESFPRIHEFQSPDLKVTFNESSEATILSDSPLYEVYSHQICDSQTQRACLVKVATLKNSSLLDIVTTAIKDYGANGEELSWPNIRKPQCPMGSYCAECLEDHVDDSVLFIPGDMYIVGIVPVHNKGATPLQCGSIKHGGLDIVESIRFAVAEAKTKPNANIGIIIIDSCNDPQIIQEKILSLHRLGVYINGEYIYVGDNILGYVGGWSSDVSKAIADITSRLKYPQISYGSTASILSSRSLYPYFLRIPSPDDKQAETILNIVQALGGNYIQILYSNTAYGQGGRDILLHLIETTPAFDMCVAETWPITTSSHPLTVLSNLRAFPKAKIVILFVGSFEIEHLIGTFNTLEKNEFLFISSEGWGTRIDVEGYSNMIGSITVTSQLTINEKLKDHMKLLKPYRSEPDPWVRPYLEFVFGCHFEWSYNKTTNEMCQGNEALDVYTTDYMLDAWSPFAERAVTALLSGAHTALIDTCNDNSSVLCANFKNNTQLYYDAIRNVKLQGNTGFDMIIFDDDGDGTAGYQIYAVTLSSQDGQYKKIGNSELGTTDQPIVLTFQTDLYNSIRGGAVNSTCSSDISRCNECFLPITIDGADGLQAGVIVVMVLLGVVCCILAGILLFICNRHGCCIKLENGRPKLTNTYLTPIYMKDRNAHGVDGSDKPPTLPPREETYDSIPASSVSYNRSQASFSAGRLPTTDGSGSSTERSASGGSRGNVAVSRQDSRQPRAIIGSDNVAFENDSMGERSLAHTGRQASQSGSQQTNSSGFASIPRETSYLNSDLTSEAHVFTKSTPAPLPPKTKEGVFYQKDGSYITGPISRADAGSANMISGGSTISTQTNNDQRRVSDQSLGYLRGVQTPDNRL